MFKFLNIGLVTIILFLVSCNSDNQNYKQELFSKIEMNNSVKDAIAYATYILDNPSKKEKSLWNEYSNLEQLSKKFRDPELVGIQGAFRAKMGAFYAKSDVVKAVESVEEAINFFEKSLLEYNTHPVISFYYGITLANLPERFEKGVKAKAILSSLQGKPGLDNKQLEIITLNLTNLSK